MRNAKARLIGLTGSFGSGKSTVLALLKKRGAAVFDSDKTVHELLKTAVVRKKILKTFGTLDSKQLATIIFKSAAQRRKIERLLHPLVEKRMREKFKTVRGKPLVCDVPLLFEAGWEKKFDTIIYVDAPLKKRVTRLRQRGFTRRDVDVRSKAQWPVSKKKGKADIVVQNDGSLADLKKKINDLIF
jgi:dephospho-CoA kinase